MFDGLTQKEFSGKARLLPCALSLANRSETLQESWSFVNDEVKRIWWDEKKQWSIKEKQKLLLSRSNKLRVALGFESVFGFCQTQIGFWNTDTKACWTWPPGMAGVLSWLVMKADTWIRTLLAQWCGDTLWLRGVQKTKQNLTSA